MDLAAPNFYLLRWRFDYANHAPIYGMWSQPGDVKQSGAWKFGMKEQMRFASVEGKDYISREIKTLAQCPGQDFVLFQWNALARINPFALKGGASVPYTTLSGLKIVSRNEIIDVSVSGEITRTLRPEAHKRIGFATYGQ